MIIKRKSIKTWIFSLFLIFSPLGEAQSATEGGILNLDYQYISIEQEEDIDLIGLHYLHRINQWFFLGAGFHAPFLRGNYGGFMAYDATAHIRQQLWRRLYFDAGASFGGGGGGASIEQSKTLSGSGGYTKLYAGFAYEFPSWAFGLGVSKMHFYKSLIDDTQLMFYLQRPLYINVGSYLEPGLSNTFKGVFSRGRSSSQTKVKFGAEINTIFQISPSGNYKDDINMMSMQLSYFLGENVFSFVGADVGIRGLPLYNQLQGGMGFQKPLTDNWRVIAQLGFGSGGYAPSEVDTGSGLLVYPKLALELDVTQSIALALSGGYLTAPDGESRNATVGLALNYYLSGQAKADASPTRAPGQQVRLHLFAKEKLDLQIIGEEQPVIHMIATQLDYVVADHWYLPIQVNLATNAYLDYPGYGEILMGLGAQTRAVRSSRWQFFAHALVGANVGGVITNTEVGLNYTLTDRFALYAQLGQSMSLDSANDQELRSTDVGLGLSYRFSLPR